MKPRFTSTLKKKRGLSFWIISAVILLVLFAKSLLPNFVVFSNDVPLGLRASQYLRTSGVEGSWSDLNSIGKDGGTLTPNVSALLHYLLSPVAFAKWFAPIALFLLGAGAWLFFRKLKLAPLACVLGGLAMMLNSTYFSAACWGVGTQCVGYGFGFCALALVVDTRLTAWIRYPLAGFALGLTVTEAFDLGAIFSVLVGVFALFHSIVLSPSSKLKKTLIGLGRVVLMTSCAVFIAVYSLSLLINTQIKGVAGMEQDTATKAMRWDQATQWSFAKRDLFTLIVPGILGYRMDSPNGGNYWGISGRDPAWDRYFASGKQGNPPQGFLRFSGGGSYAGVLVVLIAIWAAIQSFRTKSIFDDTEKKFLWFWIIAGIISLLLAFGRFAPFYGLLYQIPYASTVRNPSKFIVIFTASVVILFGYGIHGLAGRYLNLSGTAISSFGTRFKNWWTRAAAFDKRWVAGCIAAIVLSLIGWIIYRISQPHLEAYLVEMARLEALAHNIPFDSGAASYSAHLQASFSVRQVGWFILFLVASVGMMILIFIGSFSGRRATLGGILLGIVLVGDLGRANLPWIVYFNYPQKYASNPVIDLLREKPYEHRVAILPFNFPQQFSLFEQLYKIEWAQHQFQYYNVQSLDIVQMPRVPEDLLAFETALQFRGTPDTVHLLTRRWTLTNTRYLLGPAGFLDVLNQQLDPAKHRFRIVQSFNVVPKPGIENPTKLEELTAQPASNGAYALFEFTGALPRAKLYSNWEIPANNPAAVAKLKTASLTTNDLESLKSIGTNDFLTLQMLASTNFNPHETVLVADSTPVPTATAQTNGNSGSVQYESYAPKDIKLKTQSDATSVLLLNDKYDPHWKVSVDGKPAELLRCNFIMRGVYLPAGQHDVEFTFKTDTRLLYVTLAAIAVGLCLLAYVCVSGRKNDMS